MAKKPDLKPRYIIGYGERLTQVERFVTGPKPEKVWPYEPREAARRLKPKLERAVESIETLPAAACPNGETVALISLHPEALAKSYFPQTLLAGVGLRTIGCRARTLRPQKWSAERDDDQPKDVETIELYVAGGRNQFEVWEDTLDTWHPAITGADELPRIEDIRPLSDLDQLSRIRPAEVQNGKLLLEAALHDDALSNFDVFAEFRRYAHSLGANVLVDAVITVPGITFVPLRIPREIVSRLAQFSFLRSLRPAAKLRALPPESVTRSIGARFTVPTTPPQNPALRVAVLDGGIPSNHGLPGVTSFTTPNVGNAHPPFVDHGTAVTGALLWGPLSVAGPHAVPVCSVDHFRVLDTDDSRSNDVHAYHVLQRVRDVVETGSHDIFNLSLGPDISVEDDDVHPWTSTLDTLAADGSKLLIVAAGNNGEMPSPLCRVQAPSDGVNCLCVGAIDNRGDVWSRAGYSATGPGRRPGIIKPDVVAFGGGDNDLFQVVRRRANGHFIAEEMGTSFAAPLTTRLAAAIRSYFSSNLQPLTLKCLLIHCARNTGHPVEHVGWGRIASQSEILECPPGTARVIYQGELPPRQLLRARVPVPPGITGRIRVSVTVCYATEISAADPLNYTNSGVEVAFRPNADVHGQNPDTGKPSVYAKTAPFFTGGGYASEVEKRTRERKWETVLHAEKGMLSDKLKDPVFDLHFIPRIGAMNNPAAGRIRYSMAITVSAPKYDDLHDRVLAAYPQLQALTPVIVPVTV